MSALYFASFLIAFAVGFVAIKKFGISDKDILETIYGKRDNGASERSNDNLKTLMDIKHPFILHTYLFTDREESEPSLEAYNSILSSLKLGETLPSTLLNNTKISKNRFSKMLYTLFDQGLISYVDTDIIINQLPELGSKIFITGKGQELIEYIKVHKKLLNEIETPNRKRKYLMTFGSNFLIELMQRSYEQLGIDPMTGEIDIDILYTGKPRRLQSKLQIVLSMISEMERITGMVRDEDLFAELISVHGIESSEATRLIGILTSDGIIYSPQPNYYRRFISSRFGRALILSSISNW